MPRFLTEVLHSAYRMLTKVVSLVGLRDVMHTEETQAVKPSRKTRDDCTDVLGDAGEDRAQIRAVQRVYDMGDEVIAERVKAMYPKKRA